ncbi:hypothetical protein BG003_002415 [Podila horticola]|nr:hypothetical protein BG003_002415 [Podila horticola]
MAQSGYLHAVSAFLRIVENFKEAFGFQLEVADDQVVRVVYRNIEGALYDLSTSKPGRPIVLKILEHVEVKHQFGLFNPNDEFKKVQPSSDNQCIPETSIRE